MKISISSIILSLLFIIPNYAQSQQSGVITIKSMRRVSKPPTNKNFGIAIELVTTDLNGFYVGASFYCLQIGKLSGLREDYFVHYTKEGKSLLMSGDNSLVFGVTEADWKKLKNGDPMFVSYGCQAVSDYEKAKPFAFLNKKLLMK